MTFYQFVLAELEAVATFLSVLAAVFVAFLGYRTAQHRHTRDYTFSVLGQLVTNDHFFKAQHTITEYYIRDIRPSYAEMDAAERENILRLLGYYEQLSASFLRGDLDRKTVLQHRRATFRFTWKVLRPFIEERRNLLDSSRLYGEFEEFVRGYCK